MDISDNLGLVRGQKRFAAGSGRELLDVVGAEVLQKAAGLGAGQLDLAVLRHIEQRRPLPGLFVLGAEVAVMPGAQPAGFFLEDRARLGSSVVQRRACGHVPSPFRLNPPWSTT